MDDPWAPPPGVRDRLLGLRDQGEGAAPLWIEGLEPTEALAALERRTGPVFGLQRARFLCALGRRREAAEILGGLAELPEGLAAVRDRLQETVASLPAEPVTCVDRPAERLEGWLDRVRRWRSELRV